MSLHRLYLALLFVASLIFLAGCDDENSSPSEPVTTEGQDLLAVVLDNGLLLLDREKGEWLGDPLGLGTAPNDVVPVGNHLYVLNSTSCNLQEFSGEGGVIHATRSLDLGLAFNRNPYAMAATGDGRLLVSNLLSNSVSVVNLTSWQIDTLWQVGMAPEGIVVHDGMAYVINCGYDFSTFSFNEGSLYRFDLTTGERLDTLALGINAQFGEMTPDEKLAVTCTGNYSDVQGSIYLVSTDPFEVSSVTSVIGFPGRISIAPEGDAYCAAGGWSDDGEEQGLVLRLESFGWSALPELISTALGTIDIIATGEGEFYVASREGEQLQRFIGDSLVTSWPLPDLPVALTLWEL